MFLARLLGNKPPNIPAGAHAYVDGYGPLRDHYCVRYLEAHLNSDPPADPMIGPVFATASGAQMYAAFVNGTGKLDWNVNGPGKPV